MSASPDRQPAPAPSPDTVEEARRAYLALDRLEQAAFWQWVRSGKADEERGKQA